MVTAIAEARTSLSVSVRKHIPELDGIRGIAALMVVLHHLSQDTPVAPGGGRLLHVWLAATHAGWIGVDIFFGLSGFLITGILLGTHRKPHYYRNFYARRVLRLIPPYLLTLALVFALVPHSGPFLLLSLVYLANFAPVFGMPMTYAPLWSLAVEEHFYLIWPWLVKFVRPRPLFIGSFAACLVIPALRFVALHLDALNPYASWFRFDGMLWGALLAILMARASRTVVMRWSIAVGLIGAVGFIAGAAVGAMGRASMVGEVFVYGLVAMATTGMIGVSALTSRLSFLGHPVLIFFGNISYWVYLIHALILSLAIAHLPLQPTQGREYAMMASVVLTGSVLSGVIVRKWVELPAQAQKDRFR